MKRNELSQDYLFRALNTKVAIAARDANDLALSENARIDEFGNIVNREGILKIAGKTDFASALAKIDFAYFHKGIDGYHYVLIGLNNKLYYASYNDFSTWTEIKQNGSVAWTNSNFEATEWIQTTITSDSDKTPTASSVTWTIITNNTDAVAYWAGGASPSATTSDLITGTDKYLAKHLMVVAGRLLLGNIVKVAGSLSLPNYVAVSKARNAQDFDVPASGNSGDLAKMNFEVTGMSVLPRPGADPAGMTTMGLIFGGNSVEIIADTGEEDISVGVPFNARTLSTQYGSKGKNVLEVDGNVFFYTGSKLMMTNGSEPVDILDDIKPQVDLVQNDSKVVLVHDEKNKQILMGVPYINSTVNKVFGWSYVNTKPVSIDDIPMGAACEGIDTDGNPAVYIGDSRAYSLVGKLNDSNRVDWFDDSNTTGEYYGTVESTVTSSTNVDCLDPDGTAQSWAFNEMAGIVVYFPVLKETRIIAGNTVGKLLVLDSAVTLTAGDEYYIGYIPFKTKTAHHYLGDKTKMKLPTELIIRYDGTETFTMDVGLIPDFSGGEGAKVSISETSGVTFPITFPMTFGNQMSRHIVNIRGSIGHAVENIQVQFKNYKCAEKVNLMGYTIKAIPKRSIRW